MHEIVFTVCEEHVPRLKKVLDKIRRELSGNNESS